MKIFWILLVLTGIMITLCATYFIVGNADVIVTGKWFFVAIAGISVGAGGLAGLGEEFEEDK